jgi:protein-disulfide isomerase
MRQFFNKKAPGLTLPARSRLRLWYRVNGVVVAVILACTSGSGQEPPGRQDGGTSKLEAYIRHVLAWPAPAVKVTMTEARSSDLAGFSEIVVKGERAGKIATERFLVSPDGRSLIRGSVYSLARDPFASLRPKLSGDDHPMLGRRDAPVSVVLFSDLECPYCRALAKTLRTELPAYADRVSLLFADFPLEDIHPWAREAALLGKCVFRQSPDLFWKYHDWVFEHQEEIGQGPFDKFVEPALAALPGVDARTASGCLNSRAEEKSIDRTMQAGKDIGVEVAPTFFVNGRKLAGAVPWDTLKIVLDEELEFQRGFLESSSREKSRVK